MAQATGSYGANNMQVLEGLDPVRKRPGMYIGSTGPTGLHHCIWEVVDNSVDEAMAGFATRIDITLLADGACRVVDDGRGIPTDINKQQKMTGVEIALTKLHGGGNMEEYYYGGQEQVREGALVREQQRLLTIPDLSTMAVKVVFSGTGCPPAST